VFIGRRGENHFRNLEFDVSSLLGDEYPSETLTAIYKRPDGVAYPVVTSYSDGVLTWSPGSTETEIVGVGQLEIRVTHEDVVGKSVRVLTIVEEALSDGIAEPPEPPAQEWLNQVLSALAAIDVNDAYALLNLTYNLLNNNYTLLGTTHDQMESMRDTLYTAPGLSLTILHPVETPRHRTWQAAEHPSPLPKSPAGSNMVMDSVTYLFVTCAWKSGGQIPCRYWFRAISATLSKKLAEAIRGVQDAAKHRVRQRNKSSPTCTGYWTKQRFSLGTFRCSWREPVPAGKIRGHNTTLTLTIYRCVNHQCFHSDAAPAVRYVGQYPRLVRHQTALEGLCIRFCPSGACNWRSGRFAYPGPYDCHLVTIFANQYHRKGAGLLYLKRRADLYPHLEKYTTRRG
jgi:hypothetical protein